MELTLRHDITRLAAALLAGAALTCAAHAENAGFRNEKGLVFPAAAPYDNKYTNIQWRTDKAEDIGAPVAFGESVLLPSGKQILRLSEADGTREAAIDLPDTVSAEHSGVMSGSVLIQPLENGICTVDLTTGEVTSSRSFEGSIDSDCAVIDDMAYFSVKSGDSETLYCADLKNGLETIWEYTASADITSPTGQGDHVIFGAGSDLVTHHYKESTFTEIPVEDEIIGAPFASQYAVFFTDSAGNACKLRLNSDGTMERDSLVRCEVGSGPSAPLAYNSKLYVSSDTGLHVLDSVNMEISHSFPTIKGGSDPFICLGNGIRVYCVGQNEGKWELHCLLDMSEEEAPTDEVLAVMESYEGGRSAVSENGTLYFRDSYGRVYALTRVEYDIASAVIKVIIMILLIAGVFLWIRMIGKRRAANNPRY